jgi:Ni,Fe-hydrogenase I small subunit
MKMQRRKWKTATTLLLVATLAPWASGQRTQEQGRWVSAWSTATHADQFCSHRGLFRDLAAAIGIRRSVTLSAKVINESVIAQTVIIGIPYCPNMKKYLVLVLFMLVTAAAFAQPYRHHRHHRRYHHHVVVIRHHRHHYDHHEHALIAVR